MVASCAMVDLEILFSCRNVVEYQNTQAELRSLRDIPITPEVMSLAMGFQHALAKRGQHRLPIPDLLISAAARTAGLTVLHYNAVFEQINEVGGAEQEWVVPRGSH